MPCSAIPTTRWAWLAGKLADFGERLKAGDYVMTGSFTRQFPIRRRRPGGERASLAWGAWGGAVQLERIPSPPLAGRGIG